VNNHVNEPLTPRERDVARLVARGYSNRQIADDLVVAPSTAERHVANILSKLHMRSRAEIGVWAVQHESISSRPSIPGRRDTLPPELTSFVGRERALRELAELIPKTRLLTLVGSGGVGKSRLVLRLAGSRIEANGREVWLVELAGLSDPALLPQTVASVLGLRDQRGLSMVETLVAALRARPLLLVLDNCEPVVGACADLVSAMLLRCPDLQVLATSRIPLHLTAEITWPVDPLVTAEAVQLFVERARGDSQFRAHRPEQPRRR